MIKNKCLIFSFAIVAIISSSCAVFKARKPASERDSILSQIYNEVSVANHQVGLNSLICKNSYDNLYKKLFNIAGTATYFDPTDVKAIDDDIEESFETRIAIKDTFKKFNVYNSADQGCLESALDVFRALRYVEDYLIELRTDKASAGEYVNLKGEFPYFLVNPKYASDFKSYEDLKSGDVILSRGNAYSSAAIARIAKTDYQFSHVSFVYKDKNTKELFTTEAHIEIGSVTAPIEDHLNEKNTRSVVFRYVDEDTADRAAKAMYERVKKQQSTGKNIEYDFSMNYKDDSKLFCSEIVSEGFKRVLPNEDYFPKFKSKFTSGIIPFLKTIGVPANNENIGTLDVFAPGDIQFDPRFELVAEWRNPKKLGESRFKDFILTKMFEYMEKANYQIDPSFKLDVESRAYWLLRRTPLVKKFLEKKFSLTMNPTQMELFMALDKIGDIFYKNLELRSIEFDHPMTPKEIYTAIDEFVKKDYEQYVKYKKGDNLNKPLFHLLFHPK